MAYLEAEARKRQALNLQRNITPKAQLFAFSEIEGKGKAIDKAGRNSAQQLADMYRVSKSTVGRFWGISAMPSVPTWERLSERHLYELSKLIGLKDFRIKK